MSLGATGLWMETTGSRQAHDDATVLSLHGDLDHQSAVPTPVRRQDSKGMIIGRRRVPDHAELPALLCPIPPRMNPYESEARQQTNEWLTRFGLVVNDSDLEEFDSLKIPDFVCRAYPHAQLVDLQIVMDWTAWGFIADDDADSVKDLDKLQRFYTDCIAVLRHQKRAEGASERSLANIRDRVLARSSNSCLRRFGDTAEQWFKAMHTEAYNRVHSSTLSQHEYRKLREISVGMYTEYALFDVTHQCHLSDELWRDPHVQALMTLTANIIAFANDIFSVAKEKRIGDPHNLVLCLAQEHALSLQQAAEETAKIHNAEMQRFLSIESTYLGCESPARPLEHEATLFIDMFRSWIRGNLDWAMSSERYGMQPEMLDVALSASSSMVHGLLDEVLTSSRSE